MWQAWVVLLSQRGLSSNFLIQEMNQGPLHKKIFKEPLKLDKGYVIPPTGPGLGVELDYDVVKNRIVDK